MRSLILLLASLLAATLGLAATARAAAPLQPVAELDLSRYAGQWYEIARLPLSFQRDCVAEVTATYSLRSDGSISVVNACRDARGQVRSAEGAARQVQGHPGRLQVRFAPSWLSWLPMVWADYWVLELDPDYHWVMVGEPGRKYLWILAREPSMDAALFERLAQRARDLGYGLEPLIMSAPLREAAAAP